MTQLVSISEVEEVHFGQLLTWVIALGLVSAEGLLATIKRAGSSLRDNREELFAAAGDASMMATVARQVESLEGQVPPRFGELYEDLLEVLRELRRFAIAVEEFTLYGSHDAWKEVTESSKSVEAIASRQQQGAIRERFKGSLKDPRHYERTTSRRWRSKDWYGNSEPLD